MLKTLYEEYLIFQPFLYEYAYLYILNLNKLIVNNVLMKSFNRLIKKGELMFQIYKDKSNKHRFRLKAKNGENIISSQAYASRATCMKGIKSVAKHSTNKENFKTKENKAGKWNFNLIAGNNRVIATSQSYADRSSMNKGIKSVMANAPKMKIT